MSIASRISAMQEHLRDDYDVLNLAGADLTNVDKNIVNLKPSWKERLLYFMNNGTDVVWNNWDKVTGEGEEISLNNTLEAKMKIRLKGNTYQETTTQSANLFDEEYYKNTSYDVSGPINYTSLKIKGGRYLVFKSSLKTGKTAVSGLYMYISSVAHSTTGETIYAISNGSTITRSLTFTATDLYLNIIGNVQDVFDNYNVMVATTDTAYVPFVPDSPNPDYPQDIHVVSGDNSIVVGNNVFDISTITPNSFIDNNGNIYASSASNLSDYIEVKENNIILSYDYTSLVSTSIRAYCWFDSNKNFISGHLYSPVNKTNTFSVVSGAKYIRFTYDKNISNIKVSNKSASYPITLSEGMFLGWIGTYQDKIFKNTPNTTDYVSNLEDNVWYLKKEIGKVLLNGSESWTKSSNTNVNRYYIPGTFINTILNVNTIDLISDYFTCITPTQSDAYNVGLSKLNNTSIMANFSLSDTSFDTLQKFKTWLSTHNTEVYYVLSTPTYTEITDSTLISQLEAINGARSYLGQTNISQNNNDLPFIINATALKEMA